MAGDGGAGAVDEPLAYDVAEDAGGGGAVADCYGCGGEEGALSLEMALVVGVIVWDFRL